MTRLALLVAATFFMEFLDATILTTALPKMAASMGVAPIDLSVGVSIYSLTIAVFILPSAWLVDRLGPRAMLTGAIVLFTLSSALCGLSTAPWAFIAARALQGVGGAFMVPVGRLVVLRTTPKSGILRATALLDLAGAHGAAGRAAARRLPHRGLVVARDLLRQCAARRYRRHSRLGVGAGDRAGPDENRSTRWVLGWPGSRWARRLLALDAEVGGRVGAGAVALARGRCGFCATSAASPIRSSTSARCATPPFA